MNNITHLVSKLRKVVNPRNNIHFYIYTLTRTKRYLTHTIMIFAFQYLTIMNMPFSFPALPFYPPIGIAFTTFYLLGSNVILGLILGGLCAYFLKGFSPASICLYLLADIGCGCLGAILCQTIFSSDIRPFACWQEVFKFIKINLFVTCLFSSLLRLIAFILVLDSNRSPKIIFYNFLDLWLADFNAILILSGFLFSWVIVPFSREQISHRAIKKFHILTLIIFITVSLAFTKEYVLIYFYIISMFLAVYISYLYGYLIATSLLFILSSLYLTYFIAHKQQFVMYFGIESYTFAPIILLLFTLCMLYAGHASISSLNIHRKAGTKI